jgi:hypothetical protein
MGVSVVLYAIMSVFTQVYSEARDLINIFKNALCYTLAYTTVTKIDATEQDIILVVIGVSVVIFFTVIIKTKLQSIHTLERTENTTIEETEQLRLITLFTGPLECLLFLLTIATNTLTQFLSTLLARWVLTFPPSANNPIKDVLPVASLSLIMFWTLMYSVGAVQLTSETIKQKTV